MTKKYSKIQGQTLFELLVAISISALILIAIVSLSTTAISNTTHTKNNALATKYAQEAMEWIRNQRDQDWTFVQTGTRCLNTEPIGAWVNNCGSLIDGIFSRQVIISIDPLNSEKYLVEVRVTWNESGKNNEIFLKSWLTKWEN